jgi:hypothetical protein
MTMTFDDRIDNRWLTRWHSICLIEAHRHPVSQREFMALILSEHARRYRLCVSAGIARRTVHYHDLDDPRPPEPKFLERMNAAKERQRTRLHSQRAAVQRRIDAPATRNSSQ